MSLGFPSCTWYKALPVENLLVSEYNRNLPLLSGMPKIGSFINLLFISSNAFCCSSPHIRGLPLFVNSYMGFSKFCSLGQNMLTKFTTQAKLLQPFWVLGHLSFWIASSLLLSGFTQTLLFFMKIVPTISLLAF